MCFFMESYCTMDINIFFYIKFDKINFKKYSLNAFPICIAPDSSMSLLLRFNHTMLTFPYKSKVISLFVWSCKRILNLNKNVFRSEGEILVVLLHLVDTKKQPPHKKCVECSGLEVNLLPVCLPSCLLLYAWLLRLQDPYL